jgi:hypothetical protein
MGKLFTFFFSVFFCQWVNAQSIDMGAVEADLTGPGLQGWIHGAAADLNQFVFTYRDPADFFNHAEFSLIPADAAVLNALKTMKRHDEVLVFGKFNPGSSSQIHILVSKVQVVDAYDPGMPFPAHTREAQLPQDLEKATSLLATVHAIGAGGEILVVEYKDAVVPIFVSDKSLTKDLFRGDKIRVHYTIQKSPKHPAHLRLDPKATPAVELLDRIEAQHEQALTLEGSLVFFPKSPQLRFGIFALQVVDADGLKRNYTLVNFEDPQIFSDIRTKLTQLWDGSTEQAINGRNCLIKQGLRIRAEGIGNVVSPNQANPQILLEGPNSITLLTP